MNKIAVLGSGSWGTALAMVLSENNHKVKIWTRNEEQRDEMNKFRENKKYLPGINFNKNISVTSNIEDAIKDSCIVLLAVPSQSIRDICNKIKPFIKKEQIIVNSSKGLERNTSKRISEVVADVLDNQKFVTLSGPSHAEELSKKLPTTITVASTELELSKKVQDLFMNNYFRVYTNTDLIGVELGGTLKNIIAFGAGVCDGMGFGDNTKSALITRGLTEIKRLGVSLGAREETFNGLSGIGDLIVTCTSLHSRNRKAGFLIGSGYTLEDTLSEVKMVVEGIVATEVAYNLSKKVNVDMPITSAIYSILYKNVNPKDAVNQLMTRDCKCEDDMLN